MYIIEIQDLVANALIELLERSNKREVSFRLLMSYGRAVIMRLQQDDKQAYLLLSKEGENNLRNDYTRFFHIDDEESKIILNEDISLKELKEEFWSNIAYDVYLAFKSEEALRVLNLAA